MNCEPRRICDRVSDSSLSIISRTQNFHNFIKVALTKQPKRRPTSDKLLEVSGDMVAFSALSLLIGYSTFIGKDK